MSEFVDAIDLEKLKEGTGRAVMVNGRTIALFRVGETVYAMDDVCPHMGASLATGKVRGEQVTCPWHAWTYCVKSGQRLAPTVSASKDVGSYPTRVADGKVQVQADW